MITSKTLRLLALGFTLTAAVGFAASAKENWDNHCAQCHAEDGSGSTKMGKKMKLKDYTDAKVQAALKDEELLKATLDGVTEGGKQKMKGYKDALSAAEAKDLVAFIRKMKK
ncbi:MAG: cytochrome c [Opitutae bacterium]|nr:cytochrome c [Opitutae bacterium]